MSSDLQETNPASSNPAGDPKSVIDHSAMETGSLGVFLIGMLIATTGLTIVAANAPQRIRLVGVYSIAVGLFIGWAGSVIAAQLHRKLMTLEATFIGLFACAAVIGITVLPFRLDDALMQAEISRQRERHFAELAISAHLQQNGGPVPEETQDFLFASEPPLVRFRKYLGKRLQELATRVRTDNVMESPFPEFFWSIEIVLGTAGAIWIAHRTTIQESPR